MGIKTNIYISLFIISCASNSANSAIINLIKNTGYPESYTHGAGVFAGESWEDIDATCDSYDSNYAESGSVSVSSFGCTTSSASSTFNFSNSSSNITADGDVSVSVQDFSNIASAYARGGSLVDVSFSVDQTSDYNLSVIFTNNNSVGSTDQDNQLRIYQNGVLIENNIGSLTGSFITQGIFETGNTYRLVTGAAVIGDTGWFSDSAGSASSSFDMSLTLVPIPAAGYMFPFGLALLAFCMQRKTN